MGLLFREGNPRSNNYWKMRAAERKRKQMENLSDDEEVEEEHEESGFSSGKEYSAEESETDSDELYEYTDETQKKKDSVRREKQRQRRHRQLKDEDSKLRKESKKQKSKGKKTKQSSEEDDENEEQKRSKGKESKKQKSKGKKRKQSSEEDDENEEQKRSKGKEIRVIESNKKGKKRKHTMSSSNEDDEEEQRNESKMKKLKKSKQKVKRRKQREDEYDEDEGEGGWQAGDESHDPDEDQEIGKNVEDEKEESEKIECPECGLKRNRHTNDMRKHFQRKHSADYSPLQIEEILKAMKERRNPPRKDGTRRKPGEQKMDARIRRYICQWCGVTRSRTCMIKSHMNPNSKNRCPYMPENIIPTTTNKKKIHDEFILPETNKCEKTQSKNKKMKDVYAGSSQPSIEYHTEECLTWNRSWSGRCYVDRHIVLKWQKYKSNKTKKHRLPPEEYKLVQYSEKICQMQRRVLRHVFPKGSFALTEVGDIGTWLSSSERYENFARKSLNVMIGTQPDEVEYLASSTIGSYARAMLMFTMFIKSTTANDRVTKEAERAEIALRNIERNAAKQARKRTRRQNILAPEKSLVPLSDIQAYVENDGHEHAIQELLNIEAEEELAEEYKEIDRKQLFLFNAFVALDLTIHTGKRAGLLCGIRLRDVENATEEIFADAVDKQCYRMLIDPGHDYLSFKTVQVGIVHVLPGMYKLMMALVRLRMANGSSPNDRLIQSRHGYPVINLPPILRHAWNFCGLSSAITSTNMRHTIVTASRAPEHDCSMQQIRALARGMDHSVEIAERVYNQANELRATNHISIIQKVLNLNDGYEGWCREIDSGIEEDLDVMIHTGTADVLSDLSEETTEKEPPKKKHGCTVEIFTQSEKGMIEQMFKDYIKKLSENYNDVIVTEDIRRIWDENLEKMDHRSPFNALKRYSRKQIFAKVRTCIRAGRNAVTTREKESGHQVQRVKRKRKKKKTKIVQSPKL